MAPHSPNEAAVIYGYQEAAPDERTLTGLPVVTCTRRGVRRCFVHNSASSRRSSIKQVGQPRRASIQSTGSIKINLPGSEEPIRRRKYVSFQDTVLVQRFEPGMALTTVATSMPLFMKNIFEEKTIALSPMITLKIDIVKDNAAGHPTPQSSMDSGLVRSTTSVSNREVNRWNPDIPKYQRTSPSSSHRNAAKDSMLVKMPKRLMSPGSSGSSQKLLNRKLVEITCSLNRLNVTKQSSHRRKYHRAPQRV